MPDFGIVKFLGVAHVNAFDKYRHAYFQTSAEGGYHFTCTVLKGEDTAFSCVVEFTSAESRIGINVGSVVMKGHFGSTAVALRAAEHDGVG